MPSSDAEEMDEEVLEEACYYLSRSGLSPGQLASYFGLPNSKVDALVKAYESKVRSGKVTPGDFDRVFWEDVKKDAEGDIKLTFLSEKGFHHAWKSELRRLDGPALMSIYESSKDFLNADPNRKFLDFPPPKGYDPLAMEREIRKAVGVIEGILDEKWASEKRSSSSKAAKP